MGKYSLVNLSTIKKSFGRLDAEFFKPEYLIVDSTIEKCGYRTLHSSLKKIDVGHVGSMVKHYTDDGIPLLQTQNIGEFFVNMEDCIHITKTFHDKLSKSKIYKGDILIARSGSFGKASVFYEEKEINSADIIIVQIKEDVYNRDFISTFLNCKYGSKQLIRFASGGVQGHVNLTILEYLKLPIISRDVQESIGILVSQSYESLGLSKKLYYDANLLLEQALGLDKLKFEKSKSYTASFSEIVQKLRADADYFQTKYRQLEHHMNDFKTSSLSSLCEFIKGIEVGSKAYVEDGKLFIRVSNIDPMEIKTTNSDKYISEALCRNFQFLKPHKGDILITKDGTIGIAHVVDDELDGIISSGIFKLNLKDNSVPEEYLALVINSPFCRMQAERDCSGALILHWKPEDVKKLKIPILDSNLMDELADMVIRSKEERKKSQELLNRAKQRVEELIEEAAAKHD